MPSDQGTAAAEIPDLDARELPEMKKVALVLAAAGLIGVAACNKSPQADAVENAGDNAAASLDNQGDMLSAAADNATNTETSAALDNIADNAHAEADNVKDMADNKADAVSNAH